MLDWLLLPIDPARAHDISMAIAWHGRLMTLAWGVAVPVGILMARFYKILPGQDWPQQLDNHVWWISHRVLHYLAAALTLAGIGMVVAGLAHLGGSGVHGWLGWAVATLALAQILGGWLRGSKGGPTDRHPDGSLHGDHYAMTRRRLIFEHAHKAGGYLALTIALCTILTGLWRANAPIWMWLGLALWWTGLLAFAIMLQRRGRAVDTYQAIWGPDPIHPGNARKPIGLGITRPSHRKAGS